MSLIPLSLRQGGFKGAKFDLGALVITPGAIAALRQGRTTARDLVERHARGDWGDTHPGDEGVNDTALTCGERLHSVYHLAEDQTLWVITEWDRSVTTVLLPEEY